VEKVPPFSGVNFRGQLALLGVQCLLILLQDRVQLAQGRRVLLEHRLGRFLEGVDVGIVDLDPQRLGLLVILLLVLGPGLALERDGLLAGLQQGLLNLRDLLVEPLQADEERVRVIEVVVREKYGATSKCFMVKYQVMEFSAPSMTPCWIAL